MMLKESDYIALFEQLPIRDVFQHILQVPQDGETHTLTHSLSLSLTLSLSLSLTHSLSLSHPISTGTYSVSHCTSTNMLRLIAFSTSLITILGNVFTSLRHSRYKEFVKQIGRTIRYVLL